MFNLLWFNLWNKGPIRASKAQPIYVGQFFPQIKVIF